MANNCFYHAKVVGAKENVEEFVQMMKYEHPQRQFYRIFSADVVY